MYTVSLAGISGFNGRQQRSFYFSWKIFSFWKNRWKYFVARQQIPQEYHTTTTGFLTSKIPDDIHGHSYIIWLFFLPSFLFFFLSCLFRAEPVAYGSSQARGRIGAAAAGLHHNHSNSRPEPHLQPTPQLTAMPDPLTHWVRPGIRPASSGMLVRFVSTEPQWELHDFFFLCGIQYRGKKKLPFPEQG